MPPVFPSWAKLADRFGRKIIYMVSIFLFGFGSLMCGMSHYMGSFGVLIAFRAVQAIGGGGIIPIATAEFGTSFPQEKRGMALGLVGGVYGLANIFGSLAGSAILDLFGAQNWQYIFFVNIPITVFIIAAGLFILPNHKLQKSEKLDVLGILVIVSMILSLLYGLKNIDFFDFSHTITATNVYPFLIAFALLVPVFLFVEKKARDPIVNLKYFSDKRILITLALSFAAGFVLMGIVFIPQFSENALRIVAGKGGYFTVILGILSGVSAMLSGKLIDKYGVRTALFLGFGITILGALFLIFVAVNHPGLATVVISLMLVGFGLGFTIGAPINYMMLENIPDSEANSGLATVSLIRSIGTSIAPAIMVGFIAHAGLSLQTNIIGVLPNEITVPTLPYVQEITDELSALESDPATSGQLGNLEIPDLASLQTISLDFGGNSDFVISSSILEQLQAADVTTITTATKALAESMFAQMTPGVVSNIQSGLQSGIDGVGAGLGELSGAIAGMQAADAPGTKAVIDEMIITQNQMQTLLYQMNTLSAAIPGAFQSAQEDYLKEIEARSGQIETVYQSTLSGGYRSIYLTVAVSAALAVVFLLFYKKRRDDSIRSKG